MDQSTVSSLDSSSADFLLAVKQVPSSKEPMYFITLDPGMWRGAGDRIDGLRECKNTAGSWLDACVGGGVFGGYCAQGHTGPLCAVCETSHFKDDGGMCKTCPSNGIPTETFTTPIFILAYCSCVLALVGMVAFMYVCVYVVCTWCVCARAWEGLMRVRIVARACKCIHVCANLRGCTGVCAGFI